VRLLFFSTEAFFAIIASLFQNTAGIGVSSGQALPGDSTHV